MLLFVLTELSHLCMIERSKCLGNQNHRIKMKYAVRDFDDVGISELLRGQRSTNGTLRLRYVITFLHSATDHIHSAFGTALEYRTSNSKPGEMRLDTRQNPRRTFREGTKRDRT